MKYSKRYIAFTVMLALIFLLKFQIFGVEKSEVGQFRGSNLDQDVWNPIVAKDVNGKPINVVIDNQEYTSKKTDFYMDHDRNIMVPVSMLREALNCSAFIYNGKELLVEKHSASVSMKLDEKTALCNGEEVEISSPLTKKGNDLYVSLNDLSKLLGYHYSFDIANNTVTASDADTTALVPTRYDMREKQRVSQI